MRCKKYLIILALLASCTTVEEQHGANLKQADLSAITANSTKDDVIRALGSPSTKSTYGKESWYYINNTYKKVIVGENEMLQQDALVITFNEFGNVDNVEQYDLADGKNFTFSDRKTATAGHELTIMEQLLGNVGRFNPNPGDDTDY